MTPRRALLVASLALGSVVIGVMPALAAEPVGGCWVWYDGPPSGNVSSSLAPWTDPAQEPAGPADHSIVTNPVEPRPDEVVSLEYTFNKGPKNGGPGAHVVGEFFFTVDGAALGSTTHDFGTVGGAVVIPGATITIPWTAGALGDHEIAFDRAVFRAVDFGINIDCNGQTEGTSTTNPRTTPLPSGITTTTTVVEDDGSVRPTPSPTVSSSPTSSPTASPTSSPSASPTTSPTSSASPTPSPSPTAATPDDGTPVAEPFGPTEVTMPCRTLSTVRDWTATHELTIDPANPGVGSRVTVTHTISTGGKSGPVPIAAGDLVPTSTIQVTGAHTETLTAIGPAYGDIAPQAEIPGATMTASFTVADPGLLEFRVDSILFDHPQVDTTCNAGVDPIDSPAPTNITARYSVTAAPGPSSTATPAPAPSGSTTTTGATGGTTGGTAGGTTKPAPTTTARASGQLANTGGSDGSEVIGLWGTALGLTGAGLLTLLPARRRRTES